MFFRGSSGRAAKLPRSRRAAMAALLVKQAEPLWGTDRAVTCCSAFHVWCLGCDAYHANTCMCSANRPFAPSLHQQQRRAMAPLATARLPPGVRGPTELELAAAARLPYVEVPVALSVCALMRFHTNVVSWPYFRTSLLQQGRALCRHGRAGCHVRSGLLRRWLKRNARLPGVAWMDAVAGSGGGKAGTR